MKMSGADLTYYVSKAGQLVSKSPNNRIIKGMAVIAGAILITGGVLAIGGQKVANSLKSKSSNKNNK